MNWWPQAHPSENDKNHAVHEGEGRSTFEEQKVHPPAPNQSPPPVIAPDSVSTVSDNVNTSGVFQDSAAKTHLSAKEQDTSARTQVTGEGKASSAKQTGQPPKNDALGGSAEEFKQTKPGPPPSKLYPIYLLSDIKDLAITVDVAGFNMSVRLNDATPGASHPLQSKFGYYFLEQGNDININNKSELFKFDEDSHTVSTNLELSAEKRSTIKGVKIASKGGTEEVLATAFVLAPSANEKTALQDTALLKDRYQLTLKNGSLEGPLCSILNFQKFEPNLEVKIPGDIYQSLKAILSDEQDNIIVFRKTNKYEMTPRLKIRLREVRIKKQKEIQEVKGGQKKLEERIAEINKLLAPADKQVQQAPKAGEKEKNDKKPAGTKVAKTAEPAKVPPDIFTTTRQTELKDKSEKLQKAQATVGRLEGEMKRIDAISTDPFFGGAGSDASPKTYQSTLYVKTSKEPGPRFRLCELSITPQ